MSSDAARLVRDQLHVYSAAVLPFRMGERALPELPENSFDTVQRHLQQALRAAQRTGRSHFLLLGCGDGRLPDAIAAALPDNVTLTVLELHPERVRQAMERGHMGWWREAGRHRLVTDVSSWALLVLLAQAGLTSANTAMMLHPQLSEQEKEACRGWQRLFTGSALLAGGKAEQGADGPLTLGIIAHPQEPNLHEFFAHVPDWVHEVVLVWDADTMEALPVSVRSAAESCAVPVRQVARPLGGDFAAQRNAVLAACSTEWILFLDGDERLSPEAWAVLPALMRQGVGGYVFPRWTRIGSEAQCRAGFGLWPDVQLRLFRRGPQTRFERNVHEVVRHVAGPLALTLTMHIDHYSHLWKDMNMLAQKLRTFDEAAGREAMHRLNKEYPAVSCELFGVMEGMCGQDSCLLLPVTM
ncbi:glycosyltransferase [Desulfovibrio mangrovi]|uniref:glycosyltransferase n=1 Tax=Desulfovibrio mangrovi TaxID=2976983 RepID=UPI002246CC4F|nr:glycosyltransferase [Desulfovibrio mangrovi]UZP68930.1 glycosyltransferase [Desulfovibrio mangrovi]